MEWHIFFGDAPRSSNGWREVVINFFLRSCRRGFSHCWAVRVDGMTVTVVDPRCRRLYVEAFAGVGVDEVIAALGLEWSKIVRYNTKEDGGIIFPRPDTCASIIARLVGIGGFVLTPYQLYKALMRNGGDDGRFEKS